MRETRLYGSEGGGTEINRSFLPLYDLRPSGPERSTCPKGNTVEIGASHSLLLP
jgi:hypothetical protein